MLAPLTPITLCRVQALAAEAGQAGDLSLVEDCTLLEDAYLASDESELSAMIDHERGAVRDAARRVLAALD